VAQKTKGGREVPRPFEFHWGGGQIVEEASYVGTHTRASLAMPASRIAGFARDPSAPTGRAEGGGDPRS
jgi:hypothetical protein